MKLLHQGQEDEPFVPYYQKNFGWFKGPWPPIINAMLALMRRLEAEVDAPPMHCSTGHTTVIFQRPDITEGFVCWFTYGLTFVNGEGGVGDVPAYFIQDSARTVHRAETVDEAMKLIVRLIELCEAKEHPTLTELA